MNVEHLTGQRISTTSASEQAVDEPRKGVASRLGISAQRHTVSPSTADPHEELRSATRDVFAALQADHVRAERSPAHLSARSTDRSSVGRVDVQAMRQELLGVQVVVVVLQEGLVSGVLLAHHSKRRSS